MRKTRVLGTAGLTLAGIVALVLFAPLRSFAGLETPCNLISDLVATNPLSSDLASTSDDHLRCIKSAVKGTFPNVNAAVTATDEQLNPGGLGANPTGTVGLTAVNGSALTYVRSDGAPALSQAIVPTWTGLHTFTNANDTMVLSANSPTLRWLNSGGASNEKNYRCYASTTQFLCDTLNDALSTGATWFTLDRTGTVVDSLTFAATQFIPGSDVRMINSGTSLLRMRDNGQGTDAKEYSLRITGSQFALSLDDDSSAPASNPILISRSGTTATVINLTATDVQANGVSIGGATGTFTATATGCTTSPTGTATYVKNGNIVVLNLPMLTCTSNLATFTYTGMSAAIQPSTLTQFASVPFAGATCNSVVSTDVGAVLTAGSGTVTFTRAGSASGWCTSGTKGFAGTAATTFTIAYTVQ